MKGGLPALALEPPDRQKLRHVRSLSPAFQASSPLPSPGWQSGLKGGHGAWYTRRAISFLLLAKSHSESM